MNQTANRLWERASAESITAFATRRLLDTIARAYEQVPFYRWFYAASGLDPARLRTMSDVPGTSRLSPSPTCWLSPIGRNWPGLGRPGIGGFTDQRHQRDGPPDACP